MATTADWLISFDEYLQFDGNQQALKYEQAKRIAQIEYAMRTKGRRPHGHILEDFVFGELGKAGFSVKKTKLGEDILFGADLVVEYQEGGITHGFHVDVTSREKDRTYWFDNTFRFVSPGDARSFPIADGDDRRAYKIGVKWDNSNHFDYRKPVLILSVEGWGRQPATEDQLANLAALLKHANRIISRGRMPGISRDVYPNINNFPNEYRAFMDTIKGGNLS